MSHGEPRVGDELPPLVRRMDTADMVAYAGATWDWHRLHHDHAFLAERGLDRPVVDGQFFGALLAEQVRQAFGPDAVLTHLHFRFKNLVFAGETVRCLGTVTSMTDGVVSLDLRVEVVGDGRIAVAPAGATVRLSPPAEAVPRGGSGGGSGGGG